MSQGAYQAGAYPGFCNIKQLVPLVHHRVTPSINCTSSYNGESGTVRVKCFAQEHKTVFQLELEPRLLCLEMNA